jgi:AraC-like DNA-binding protein
LDLPYSTSPRPPIEANMTTLTAEDQFEKTMLRSGLEARGGSITRKAHRAAHDSEAQGVNSWGNRFAGLFVINKRYEGILDCEMMVLRDVIACGIVLNDTSTQLVVDQKTFEAGSSIMTTIYLPRGKRFHYSTCSNAGLRSVTAVIDIASFLEANAIQSQQLPRPIRNMIGQDEPVMEQIRPSQLVMRVVNDIILRRGMFPSLPSLYLEGKTLELMSSWMHQLSHGDSYAEENADLDSRTLARVAIAKAMIERKPAMSLNINTLARAAAMNRTKLRSAFKAVYGMTLLEYRTSLVMQSAEQALKQPGMTVQEAAFQAGYANASSFIVAYKRYFGASPGKLQSH